MRSISFIPFGVLNPEVSSETYLDNDSDREDNAFRSYGSENATPSRSSHSSSRSLSASPACTPASITKELTEIDTETVKKLVVKKRKRLTSERGEIELKFPVCDERTTKYNWKGCSFLNANNRCGSGLLNPSNYCFLNSVLQSIVHTAQLSRYLVESHGLSGCRQPCLGCNLKRHILRVVRDKTAYDPYPIRSFFSKIFPSHRRDNQEDAHEMLTLLLSALEPPLPPKRVSNNGANCSFNSPFTPNRLNGSSLTLNGSTTSTLSLNGSGCEKKQNMISCNASDKVASTPIEQIFGGNLRNQITCQACFKSHTNYEKIREINLGLHARYNGQQVRLIQLMNDFFAEERIFDFVCEGCGSKQTALRRTTLLSPPSVLIIQLKRFNCFGGKNRLPVRSESLLHMDKYMYNKQAVRYRFSGIIRHIGGGLNYGHYIAAFRGFDDRSWFQFDDNDVLEINEQNALNMEPYIMFYTRIRGDPLSTPVERPLQIVERNLNNSQIGQINDNDSQQGKFFTNGFASNGFKQALMNGSGDEQHQNSWSSNGSLQTPNKRPRFSTESPTFKPVVSQGTFASKPNNKSSHFSFTFARKQQVQRPAAVFDKSF